MLFLKVLVFLIYAYINKKIKNIQKNIYFLTLNLFRMIPITALNKGFIAKHNAPPPI